MFPCSSIYQHFPRTNQTPNKIIIDHHHHHNNHNHYTSSFQIDGDDHHSCDHHHYQNPVSSNDHSSAYSVGDFDGVILNSLQDHQGNQNPAAVVRRKWTPSGGRKKKDRHSKIRTAHGVRDRRMRLSLQIARKFFDLQDLLGFDKASRTIDWLFAKSSAAIDELKDSLTSSTATTNSGGEFLRKEVVAVIDNRDGGEIMKGINRKVQRAVARARARARTRSKMLHKITAAAAAGGGFELSSEIAEGGFIPMFDHSDDHPLNPSFVFMPRITTTTTSSLQNPNFAEIQNPNPIFMASLNILEENPTSDIFLANSNILCTLNF